MIVTLSLSVTLDACSAWAQFQNIPRQAKQPILPVYKRYNKVGIK